MRKTAPNRLEENVPVELSNEQRKIHLDTRQLKRQAEALLKAAKLKDQTLSVLLTDDRRMAAAHLRWMGEPGPTDVMSFPMGEVPGGRASILGDIVISVEMAARRKPKEVHAETLSYLLHGLLHLMGHDHLSRAQQQKMSGVGRRLMKAIEGELA